MSMSTDCMDLQYLVENEKASRELLRMAEEKGRQVPAYSGVYCNLHFNSVQVIAGGVMDPETGTLDLRTGHVHNAGTSLWRCRVLRDITPEGSSELDRRLLVEPVSGRKDFTVVDVMNADILPSYAPGEVIEMQTVAKTHKVLFFPDRESCIRSEEEWRMVLPRMERTSKPLREGCPIPLGFLSSDAPDKGGKGWIVPAAEKDSLVYLKGTVLSRSWFDVDVPGPYGKEIQKRVFTCKIGTDFGKLQLILRRDQYHLAVAGTTIAAFCTIQGDVMIGDYDYGKIVDPDHDRMVLRDAFSSGRMDRLLPVLSEDCAVFVENGGRAAFGREDVVAYLAGLYEQFRRRGDACSFYGVVDSCAEGKPAIGGSRCVVAGQGGEAEADDALHLSVNCDVAGRIRYLWLRSCRGFRIRKYRSHAEMVEDELVRKGISPAVLKAEKAFADFLNREGPRDAMTDVIASILEEKAVLEYGDLKIEGMDRVLQYLEGLSGPISSEAGFTVRPVYMSRDPDLDYQGQSADTRQALALISKLEKRAVCYFLLERKGRTGKVTAIRGECGADVTYIIDYYEEWDPVPEAVRFRICRRE